MISLPTGEDTTMLWLGTVVISVMSRDKVSLQMVEISGLATVFEFSIVMRISYLPFWVTRRFAVY